MSPEEALDLLGGIADGYGEEADAAYELVRVALAERAALIDAEVRWTERIQALEHRLSVIRRYT